jgi:hypothetical protein
MSEQDSKQQATKDPEPKPLDEAQVEQVAGGDGDCGVTIGSGGISVSTDPSGIGPALTETYEGVVAATSHIIERVVDSMK